MNQEFTASNLFFNGSSTQKSIDIDSFLLSIPPDPCCSLQSSENWGLKEQFQYRLYMIVKSHTQYSFGIDNLLYERALLVYHWLDSNQDQREPTDFHQLN